MFDLSDLKGIILLSHLTDPMLKKIQPVTHVRDYLAGEYIYKEGEYAEHLFAVVDGRVGLEIEKTPSDFVRLTEITRGMTFGLASLVDTERKRYLLYAKVLANTSVFVWKSADLEKLFFEDFEMGFIFMRRVAKILDTRLETTFAQIAEICK
jgi:CRP/FNR family cyclic AMP-dependent transcriptional regulator